MVRSGKTRRIMAFQRGSTRLGVLDVLTALILLAILVWASWKQFPAYDHDVSSRAAVRSSSPKPEK
ncbi:MAG TPA: hypothetical protein VJN94_09270 [Candidatus Binataceae bacterium]|nr:hypothetical protein [Candidatus Binataceae bacterium]